MYGNCFCGQSQGLLVAGEIIGPLPVNLYGRVIRGDLLDFADKLA